MKKRTLKLRKKSGDARKEMIVEENIKRGREWEQKIQEWHEGK